MENNILNTIGKLTLEINDIKDVLKNTTDKITRLENDVKSVVNAGNSFAEKVDSLDKEWQENRELIIAERKRRAKLSSSLRKNKNYRIVDEVGFGGRLRAMRRKRNLYVADLSKQTLVPETTIGSIENFRLKYIAKEYIESLNKFFEYDFYEYVAKNESEE